MSKQTKPTEPRDLHEYTDANDQQWRDPSDEELEPGHPVHDLIAETLESWAPNYLSDTGRVSSYTDWVERVEGLRFPGEYVQMSLGQVTDAPPFTTVRKMASKVAKDLR